MSFKRRQFVVFYFCGIQILTNNYMNIKMNTNKEEIKLPMIAIGGSVANLVTYGYVTLNETVCDSMLFEKVIWIPSGSRLEKPNMVDAKHREAMTRLAFSSDWRARCKCEFELNLADIHKNKSTTTIDWLRYYQKKYPQHKIVWYTGIDTIMPQKRYNDTSEIQYRWVEGENLWSGWTFVIVNRYGYKTADAVELPRNNILLDLDMTNVSSTIVRNMLRNGESVSGLVPESVRRRG